MTKTLIFMILMCGLICTPKFASADCNSSGSAGGSLWGPSGTTVDVWVLHDPLDSTVGLRAAIGKTQIETMFAVRRAVAILNEETGAAVRLRVVGTTSSSNNINGALLIKGGRCLGSDYPMQNAIGQAKTEAEDGVRYTGWVRLFDGQREEGGVECTPVTWSFSESSNRDVVGILMHELGHAIYDMGDVNEGGCSAFQGQFKSLMIGSASLNGPFRRLIKDFDAEWFQRRYPNRNGLATMRHAYKTGASTWQAPVPPVQGASVAPLYRMGSLGSYGTSGVPKVLGYVNKLGSAPIPGGAGVQWFGRYGGGLSTQYLAGNSSAMLRPVAVARQPGSNHVIAAYIKRTFANLYIINHYWGTVCYRMSTNAGVSFGPEVCGSKATGQGAIRNGLSATYEYSKQAFLIAFAGDNFGATDVGGFPTTSTRLKVWTVPAAGSTATSQVVNAPITAQSLHGPSIACAVADAGPDTCIMVFESMDTIEGCAKTIRFTLASSGAATFSGAPDADTSCVVLYDQPALLFNPVDNNFLLAKTDNSNQWIVFYTKTRTGLTWSYNATLTSAGSFVSTPALGYYSASSRVQVWYLSYW